MTAKQHRIFWIAKRKLKEKYPDYYYVFHDGGCDWVEGETPSRMFEGNAFDCLNFCTREHLKEEFVEDKDEWHWNTNYLINKFEAHLDTEYGYFIRFKDSYTKNYPSRRVG